MNMDCVAPNRAETDLLLERMFRARRIVLWAGAVLAGLLLAPYLCVLFPDVPVFLFTELGFLLLAVAHLAALLVIIVGSVVTCYYVFRIGLLEAGLGYALGHGLLFAGMAFCMFPIGIIFIPMLIRCDVERWRRWEDRASNDCGVST